MQSPSHPEGAQPPSRRDRKRSAILEAAETVFLDNGYVGASMDEIAALAAVSKQTVYKHFGDKETLFTEVVTTIVNRASDPVHDEVQELAGTGDVEADLRDLARRQLERVMTSTIMRLRRLVIGEVNRFPELARTFYQKGPGRTIATLAEALEELSRRGVLHIEDPALAAEHLNWAFMATPLHRAMFLGEDEVSPGDLDRYAREGVTLFMARYGPLSAADDGTLDR
ncbi:MAG: TetR/AcrR family transcriptional regulator [Actinomycetota bacterium]